MCSRTKYPYLSHKVCLRPPTPLEIPFKLHTFLYFLGAYKPPTHKEIPIPSRGGIRDIFSNCTCNEKLDNRKKAPTCSYLFISQYSFKSLHRPLDRSFRNFCIAANCLSGSSEYNASTTSGENTP